AKDSQIESLKEKLLLSEQEDLAELVVAKGKQIVELSRRETALETELQQLKSQLNELKRQQKAEFHILKQTTFGGNRPTSGSIEAQADMRKIPAPWSVLVTENAFIALCILHHQGIRPERDLDSKKLVELLAKAIVCGKVDIRTVMAAL